MNERIEGLNRLAEEHPSRRTGAFLKAAEAARDPQRELRAAAAHAVATTGDPQPALDLLRELSRDADVGVRLEAAASLSGTPWRGRFDALAPLLEDEDPGVVLMAADGMAHGGDRRAVDALHWLLRFRRLKFGALEGLLALDDAGLEPLAAKLFGGLFVPPFERALGAVALARKGSEDARAWLRRQVQKRRAEERPFIVVHLAEADPQQGRQVVEQIAAAEDDYLRETALLALARLDRAWWPRAQEAIARYADEDPHVSAEVLLGLFEIDAERALMTAAAQCPREDELGAAARRVRLAAALRQAFPEEVQTKCA